MSTLAKWKPETRAIMSTFEAKMSTFDDSGFGNVHSFSKESTFPRADPPWHFDQKSTMRTQVYTLTKCQENINVMLTLGTQVSGSDLKFQHMVRLMSFFLPYIWGGLSEQLI